VVPLQEHAPDGVVLLGYT